MDCMGLYCYCVGNFVDDLSDVDLLFVGLFFVIIVDLNFGVGIGLDYFGGDCFRV